MDLNVEILENEPLFPYKRLSLTVEELLISLSVFLFDRELSHHFYPSSAVNSSRILNPREIWDTRISLIFYSILESHTYFLNYGPQSKESAINLSDTTISNSQNLDSQSTCIDRDFSSGPNKSETEDEFNMDSFLKLLEDDAIENLNAITQDGELFLDQFNITFLLQSFYLLNKAVMTKDYSLNLDSHKNDCPPSPSPTQLDADLDYIKDWSERSTKTILKKNYGGSETISQSLNLSDLIDWTQYIGEGLFNNLSLFLSRRFLEVPSMMLMNRDTNIKSFQLDYDNNLGVQLDISSSILNNLSLFLLSMKADPFGKGWSMLMDNSNPRRCSTHRKSKNSTLSSTITFDENLSLSVENSTKVSKSETITDSTILEKYSIFNLLNWSKLFSTSNNGFGMSPLLNSTLHYNAPTVLVLSGKVLSPQKSSGARSFLSETFDSLSSIPQICHSTISKDVFPVSPGDQIKIGVYISTGWVESKKQTFGNENCFIFLIEPYYKLLVANPPSIFSRKNVEHTISSFSVSKNGDPLPKFTNDACTQCYATCLGSSGVQFGGVGHNDSITASRISSSLISLKKQKSNPSLFIDVSSELAYLINDPFSVSPGPAYSLLSDSTPFRVDISVDQIELYGLGGDNAANAQHNSKIFEESDIQRRRTVNIKSHSRLNDDAQESDLQTSKWILEASGLLPSKK
ncbi:Restriction of telomere capping protein 5 [Smittium mucronatum]|uniref:Restriction of telomere capping protein 5 n=1 Tax=Smittium mucronatum TaxID=133383 RepID=A0A1R0GQZ0_9FUNG|nr:Restriction of telomere capping protein 5 [Smittium mucronatum]